MRLGKAVSVTVTRRLSQDIYMTWIIKSCHHCHISCHVSRVTYLARGAWGEPQGVRVRGAETAAVSAVQAGGGGGAR